MASRSRTLVVGFSLGVAAVLIAHALAGERYSASRDRNDARGVGSMLATLRALRARVADLEGELALSRADRNPAEHEPLELRGASQERAGGASDTGEGQPPELPTLEDLLAWVDASDGESLERDVLLLLRARSVGYSTLIEFLGVELRSPRRALFGSKPLLAALMGLGFRHGEEVAAFGAHLLSSAESIDDLLVDEQVHTVLPAFLTYHGARFDRLRALFESRLVEELRSPGDARWRALRALDDLGSLIPSQLLLDVLVELEERNEPDSSRYRLIMKHVRLHPEGLDILLAYLDGVTDPAHGSVRHVLHTLGRMDLDEARDVLARFEGVEEFSDLALRATRSRSLDSALEFLESPADIGTKGQFLRELAEVEPTLLEELEAEVRSIEHDDARRPVENDGNLGLVSDVQRLWLHDIDGLEARDEYGTLLRRAALDLTGGTTVTEWRDLAISTGDAHVLPEPPRDTFHNAATTSRNCGSCHQGDEVVPDSSSSVDSSRNPVVTTAGFSPDGSLVWSTPPGRVVLWDAGAAGEEAAQGHEWREAESGGTSR